MCGAQSKKADNVHNFIMWHFQTITSAKHKTSPLIRTGLVLSAYLCIYDTLRLIFRFTWQFVLRLWKPLNEATLIGLWRNKLQPIGIIVCKNLSDVLKMPQKIPVTRNLANRIKLTEAIGCHFSTDVAADREQSSEDTNMKLMFQCHDWLLSEMMRLIWMMLIIPDNSFPSGNTENVAVIWIINVVCNWNLEIF